MVNPISNVRYLENENGVQTSEISFLASQNKTQTSIIRSKRTNQADQIQVSLINFDGKDFIAFRKLLHSNSYLIILFDRLFYIYVIYFLILLYIFYYIFLLHLNYKSKSKE